MANVTVIMNRHEDFYIYLNIIQTYLVARVRVLVFNGTFNNISVILWRSGFFVEENGGPGGKQRPAASH